SRCRLPARRSAAGGPGSARVAAGCRLRDRGAPDMASSGVWNAVGASGPDTGQRLLSWRLRVVVALLVMVAAAYSLVCLDYNAPASPASVRLASPVDTMMDTYFTQDWML